MTACALVGDVLASEPLGRAAIVIEEARSQTIIPGADADLVLLGSEGHVEETIIGGESVYRREENL
jgi:N-acetylglucosamine-6-phosphate deacetylase